MGSRCSFYLRIDVVPVAQPRQRQRVVVSPGWKNELALLDPCAYYCGILKNTQGGAR